MSEVLNDKPAFQITLCVETVAKPILDIYGVNSRWVDGRLFCDEKVLLKATMLDGQIITLYQN